MARKLPEKLEKHKFQNLPYEERHKIAMKGVEVRQKNREEQKDLATFIKLWAKAPLTANERTLIQKAGLSEVNEKKALLALSLLNNALKKGDRKSIQYVVTLLGEDRKYELEIKKLKAQIDTLEAEKEYLESKMGSGNDIEDLSTLADALRSESSEMPDVLEEDE